MTREREHAESAGTGGVPRRAFLGGAGTLLAAGMASMAASGRQPAAAESAGSLPQRPNIVVIITDQEREPMHWPEGWAQQNLPNRQRLANQGLTFNRAYCNSAMCSPSRATFFTGLYPAQHGVTNTLTEGGTLSPSEPQLRLDEQNMAKLLASAGYNVQYRGKWHLSKNADGGEPNSADLAAYGFDGWVPPELGQDIDPAHFGGGCADLDRGVAEQAADFLRNLDPTDTRPFALIVSLANPHDILAYPQTWDQQDGDCDNYGSAAPVAFNQGIDLPPTADEVLALNFKPSAQVQSQLLLAAALGPLVGVEAMKNYANFYAYVQKVVDNHIGTVLDALDATPGLRENSVVFRISDHGEMGLSHGGLRQKVFNVYEETTNVPLVISNPVLFPGPVKTDALASLIDVMPTLATLAHVPDRASWNFLGTDLAPVIAEASARPGAPVTPVQEFIHFTYDDQNPGAPDGQFIVQEPSHIRAIWNDRWKYALYFDPAGVAGPQYEMYDLLEDPYELHNMAVPGNVGFYSPEQAANMHAQLIQVMAEKGTTPPPGTF
ncbi:sulfatase [Rhodococcus sp. WMMA185]|uniref:sulfatase-like hydrolase/transferase n=1 Tax=Rhodococcus sp. WMMA185 TaxID=679318 RepID=UPI0008786655|nr:sulfatase-like hydrolase/transferase [Rhodococcus sp. WMMA185]AOW92567.1 sulfatase [Rhodococcus sp. WMMA185]